MSHDFKKLELWKRSVDLAVRCYRVTKYFPQDEKYGLTSQITRAAVSIPSNIAEGTGRGSKKDFSRFLDISRGSSNELETLLIIAEKTDLVKADSISPLLKEIDEIQKMLNAFKTSLLKAHQKV